jgi:hypothetical protein
MRSWSVGLFTALLSLAGPDAATASGVAVPEAGAETAPPTIPVEAFTAPAGLADAELSATGAAFAYVRVEDGKAILKVHSSDDLRALSAVDLGSADDVNWFRWAGDDTLLVSVMLEQENNRYHARFSRLMAFDVPRQTLRYVGLKQGIVGDDVIHVDRAGRYFLLSVRRDQAASPEVWRVSLDQGEGAEPERVQEKTPGRGSLVGRQCRGGAAGDAVQRIRFGPDMVSFGARRAVPQDHARFGRQRCMVVLA